MVEILSSRQKENATVTVSPYCYLCSLHYPFFYFNIFWFSKYLKFNTFNVNKTVYIIECSRFNNDLFLSIKLSITFTDPFYGLLGDIHSLGVKLVILSGVKRILENIA